jgi:hypothetical protein
LLGLAGFLAAVEILSCSLYSTDSVMNIYIKTMTEDDDKEVVAQACMSIADIIKEYGYMAIEPCKYMSSCLHFAYYSKKSFLLK